MNDDAFNAGRDLAVEFILEAQASMGRYGDCEAANLSTAAGLFRPVFERLRERPETVDGFDAVLGEFLAITSFGVPDVERIAELTNRDGFARSCGIVAGLRSGKVASLHNVQGSRDE